MNEDRTFRPGFAVWVFAVALAVRALFVFALEPRLGLSIGPAGEDFHTLTDGYIDLAVNLVDHHRYAFLPEAAPTTYRAPLFPFALAAVYSITRDIAAAVLWVNIIASSLTCVLLYWLAVRVMGHRRMLWLMAPVVLFPLSIYYCASSYSDTFFALTASAYLVSILQVFARPGLLSGVVAAVAFAAAVLTKSVLLPLPLVFVGYALLRCRTALATVVLSSVIGLALLVPWTVRNHAVSGAWVPVCGGGGFNMLVGTYMIDEGLDPGKSYVHGELAALDRLRADEGIEVTRAALRTGDHLDLPPGLDRAFGRSARRVFAEDPWLLLRKAAVNSWRFWAFSSTPEKTLMNVTMNLSVLILGALTLAHLWRRDRGAMELIALFTVFFGAVYAVIIVHSARFCLPVVLTLTPFAAAALVRRDLVNKGRGGVVSNGEEPSA